MDVRLPSGEIVRNVPDGTTKAQLMEKLRASGRTDSWLGAAVTPEPVIAEEPAEVAPQRDTTFGEALQEGVDAIADPISTLSNAAKRVTGGPNAVSNVGELVKRSRARLAEGITELPSAAAELSGRLAGSASLEVPGELSVGQAVANARPSELTFAIGRPADEPPATRAAALKQAQSEWDNAHDGRTKLDDVEAAAAAPVAGEFGDAVREAVAPVMESAPVKNVRQWTREKQQEAEAALTPAARRAIQLSLVERDEDGDLQMGEGASDPWWWTANVIDVGVQAAPGLGTTAVAARMSYAAKYRQVLAEMATKKVPQSVAIKYAEKQAMAAAKRAAMISGGLVEGSVAGGQDAAQVRATIDSLDEQTLMGYPGYIELRDQGMTHEQAREKIASDKAASVAIAAGSVVGLTGAPMNSFFGSMAAKFGRTAQPITAGNRAVSGLKAAAGEGAQEFVQEGAEGVIQNLGEQEVTGEDAPWKGVLEQAITGGVLGTVVGGPIGAAGHKSAGKEKAEPEKPANANSLAAAEAAYTKAETARKHAEDAARDPKIKVKHADLTAAREAHQQALVDYTRELLNAGRVAEEQQEAVANALQQAEASGVKSTSVKPNAGATADKANEVPSDSQSKNQESAPPQLDAKAQQTFNSLEAVATAQDIADADKQQLIADKLATVTPSGATLLTPAGRRRRADLGKKVEAVQKATLDEKKAEVKQAAVKKTKPKLGLPAERREAAVQREAQRAERAVKPKADVAKDRAAQAVRDADVLKATVQRTAQEQGRLSKELEAQGIETPNPQMREAFERARKGQPPPAASVRKVTKGIFAEHVAQGINRPMAKVKIKKGDVPGAPESGALVNIGLNVNDGSKLTEADVVAALEKRGVKITRRAVQQSNTEPTLVASLDRELTDAEAGEISKELKQDAIAQLTSKSGALHGPNAALWGEFNPEYFLTHSGKPASEKPDTVKFKHFSTQKDLSELDPNFMGSGAKGAEAKRAGPKVLALYSADGEVEPDVAMGKTRYDVEVAREDLYDASADPQGFYDKARVPVGVTTDENGHLVPVTTRFDMNKFEELVRGAGFKGYFTPDAPGILKGQARLFVNVPIRRSDATTQTDKSNTPRAAAKVKAKKTPEVDVLRHLTDVERNKLRASSTKKLIAVFDELPAGTDFASAALAGQAKRGWYERSAKAITEVFGADAPRFAALLAALSPQTSVEWNFRNAVSIWTGWDKAGRPQTRAAIKRVMRDNIFPNTARVGKANVLEAWANNSVEALTTANPESVTLSGPKVDSFAANLRGETNRVTLDVWMANFANVNQKLFKGEFIKPGDPGLRPGYSAYSARVREAAEILTQRTGETWTPAEVQETVWSWAKTVYEQADMFGTLGTATELVQNNEITDELINATPDFAGLFASPEVKSILAGTAYGDRAAVAVSGAQAETGAGGEATPLTAADRENLERAAKRLDQLRKDRAAAAIQETPAKGIPFSTLKAVADRVALELGVEARVVEDVAALRREVPIQFQADIDQYGEISGLFLPDEVSGYARIFLVRENTSTEREAYDTALHEVVGHLGLRAVLGEDYGAVMTTIYNSFPAQVRGAARRNNIDLNPANEAARRYNRQLASEELVAYSAGRLLSMRGATSKQSVWNRILDVIRRALRAVGALSTYNQADIEALIYRARDHFRKPAEVRARQFAYEQSVAAAAQQGKPGPVWHSALEHAIEDLNLNIGSSGQWIGSIKNLKGVKTEEVEWLGLNRWLSEQEGKVTREQVLGFIAANKLEIKDVVKGYEFGPDDMYTPLPGTPTKYAAHQTPGGSNYKELLITLPTKKVTALPPGYRVVPRAEVPKIHDAGQAFVVMGPSLGTGGGEGSFGSGSTPEAAIDAAFGATSDMNETAFRSSHFSEPNILAHVRFNERTIDGKKVLFIEEVQSDWHQQGRKSGYAPPPFDYSKWTADQNQNGQWRVLDADGKVMGTNWAGTEDLAIQRVINQISNNTGVPDAPFKTSWPELAMKRMIRYAAENGFDTIAWTTGEMQAERYDLSKQVDSISWHRPEEFEPTDNKTVRIAMPGNFIILDVNPDGTVKSADGPDGLEGKQLDEVVGKDVADKIMAADSGKLEGTGLRVGGEGMKGFYDKVLPKTVDKYTKKWGGKVVPLDLAVRTAEFGRYIVRESDRGDDTFDVIFISPDGDPDEVHSSYLTRARAQAGADKLNSKVTVQHAVHSLPITPQMRESVLESQPMFKVTPQTESDAFKQWFGLSRAVTSAGEPQQFYHGTRQDIEAFGVRAIGTREKGWYGDGFYFTSEPKEAESYARTARRAPGEAPTVIPVYLKMENPFITTTNGPMSDEARQKLRDDGYDGVMLVDSEDPDVVFEAVVFEPTQIKSSVGNRGTFDPKDPRIAFSFKQAPTGDPDLDNFIAKIGGKKQTLRQRWQQWNHDKADRVAVAAFDRYHGIKRAEDLAGISSADSGYKSAVLSGASGELVQSVIEYGPPVWNQGAPDVGKGQSLLGILKPLKSNVNLWLTYMTAKRANRLMSEGRENLFDAKEIAAALKLGTQHPEFDVVAQAYAKLQSQVLDFAQEAGVIDPAGRAVWENADYIPFYRIIENGNVGVSAKGGKGIGFVRNQIRRLRGGEANIGDPLENIVRNWLALMDASLKAHAGRQIVDNLDGTGLVTKHPSVEFTQAIVPAAEVKKFIKNNPTLVQTLQSVGLDVNRLPSAAFQGLQKMLAVQAPTDPDVISVWRAGKREYWKVHDPLLFIGLQELNAKAWGPLMKLLTYPKRLLTAGVTLTPQFSVKNYLRDVWHVFVQGAKAGNVKLTVLPHESLAALPSTIRMDATARSLLASGGSFTQGYVTGGNLEGATTVVRRSIGRRSGTASRFILDSPGKLWRFYRDLQNAAENANRVAIYRKGRKAGLTHKEAAYEARDLLDFSKKGAHPVMQFLVDSVPFFNARVQGLNRLGRALKTDLVSVGLRGLLITAATAAILARNWDDERYKALTDQEKSNYWHFFDVFEDGDHWKFPKPFEVGFLFGTIPESIGDAMLTNADEPDAVLQSAQLVGYSLGQSLNLAPEPALIWPMVELAINKDSFTQAPILTDGDEKLLPEDQFGPRTSPTYRELAGLFPETAPTSLRSPKALEHLGRGYLGNLQDYALLATDALVREARGEPAPPAKAAQDLPGLRDFRTMAPARNTKYITSMYELATQAAKVQASIKKNEEAETDEGDARVEELEADNELLLDVAGDFKDAAKRVNDLKKQQREVQLDPSMTPAEKREEIDALQSDINEEAESVWDLRPGGKLNRETAVELLTAPPTARATILRKNNMPATADLLEQFV